MLNTREGFARGLLAAAVSVAFLPALANEAIDDLSLEELSKTEISSVARRSQSLANVPAAAFVISAEDIRRSGATVLPDVLRMVPGIEVAQIDNGRYAVTARGFNGRFCQQAASAGRWPQYLSPDFLLGCDVGARCHWRSTISSVSKSFAVPGAAIWGVNAVNGVINIISKPLRRPAVGGFARNDQSLVSRALLGLYGRYGGAYRCRKHDLASLLCKGRHAEPSKAGMRRATDSERSASRATLSSTCVSTTGWGGGSDLAVWQITATCDCEIRRWLDLINRVPVVPGGANWHRRQATQSASR